MIKVGVLGATGMVGQRFIESLINHPWFELSALIASDRSSGKRYGEVMKAGIDTDFPEEIREMEVLPIDSSIDAELLFSALPADIARDVEPKFAKEGFAVASNASAYRMEEDVPLVIPEVNPDHLALIDEQKKNHGWGGFIVTNPNCSTITLALTLKPLECFDILDVKVATMQAVSGAGYDGVPSMAILDNIIPYIPNEEEKVEEETPKILGRYDGRVKNANFSVSASCHRVPVLDGHTEAVWVEMGSNPSIEDVKDAFIHFKTEINTPTAPDKPIIVREELNRPQPRLDRDTGRGMTVSVGRIREGIKYIAMGHNTIRGAAGASVLNAELLVREGYI
jgi:aspartate-semialdehyde dehydrogenase